MEQTEEKEVISRLKGLRGELYHEMKVISDLAERVAASNGKIELKKAEEKIKEARMWAFEALTRLGQEVPDNLKDESIRRLGLDSNSYRPVR